LQRTAALQAASAAREEAQAQRLRNTLLAAISHDHRTPLATILGAASALHDQGERLPPAQRQRLAARIVDEATQLRRLTDNTLQLARLDTPGLALTMDWESVEEIVGSVLHRLRQRRPLSRVTARLEPGLPLLRCDAVLLVQLLDNLVDNALTHGAPSHDRSDRADVAALVEIMARTVLAPSGPQLLLAVRDRGGGVPRAWRERIFDTFQRGAPSAATTAASADVAEGAQAAQAARPGAGVGLALCRAIARAHGGELTLRARAHGGSSFECTLPLAPAPPQPPQEAA
jgi:two-component system, OmpR family, sensor histidine kinase KdpD